SNSRQGQQEAHDAPATAPDDRQSAPAREPQFAVGGAQDRWAQGSSQGSSHGLSQESSQESSQDYYSPAAQSEADSRFYDELHVGADQQTQYYDDNRTDDGQHDAQEAEAEYYYQDDDVPLDPHENAIYDDAPRARRGGGLVTARALTGRAVSGTAGAYAYRSYFSNPSSTQPPPVITADNSTPTKIVPASAGDPQSINVAQDRSANPDKEQIVSKQEEPVALKDLATQAAPRVVLPAPVAPGQGANASEPKKIRTVVIRPDASDASGKPVSSQPAAAPRPAAAPAAPKAATASAARNGAPISLEPQPSEPAAAPAARTRTAAAPPAAPEATESTAGGFVVQLSSQKSEAEAQSSFRSLQAKFPN